jgi:chemotaxis protein histidine kinase CheA
MTRLDPSDEILADFLAGADDYYQVVMEGVELMHQGQISQGIDLVLRPVHTIKGTAGFIPGLEGLQSFCHRVEDLLKDLQSGRRPASAPAVQAVSRALGEIFNLLDQLRSGAAGLDCSRGEALLAEADRPAPEEGLRLPRRAGNAAAEAPAGEPAAAAAVVREEREGVAWLRVRLPRLHLPSQYGLLVRALERAGPGQELVLDLSEVRTLSSTAWGEIWQAGQARPLAVVGMSLTVQATFLAWGLDRHIRAYPDEASFWSRRRGGAA